MNVRNGILAGAMLASATLAPLAQAQIRSQDAVSGLNLLQRDEIVKSEAIPVMLNNRSINFPDVQPVLFGDEIMVPMRGVFEHMNAEVLWKPETRQVIATRGSTTVILPIGTPLATVNGENKVMDHPPFILNGRTMVPLRFLSYTLHAGTVVMGENNVVRIIPNHGVENLALITNHDH